MARPSETIADGGLGLDEHIAELRELAGTFRDERTGRNAGYAVADAVLAATLQPLTPAYRNW